MPNGRVLAKRVTFCGQPVTVACDGRCDKAWGINNRPRLVLSADPDDYAFLADHELGAAPACPGTWEGGHGKPCAAACDDPERLNKWCARECERSALLDGHRDASASDLPDFSARHFNMPWREATGS